MGLGGLSSLAKAINRAQGGEDFNKMFVEEFELFFKSSQEDLGTKEDRERWLHEQGTPYAFHPSNLGACERSVFYNFLKYEPQADNTDAVMKSIQDYGTDRHERVQKAVFNMPPAFDYVNPLIQLEIAQKMGLHTYLAQTGEDGVKEFGIDTFEFRMFNTDIPLWFKTDGIFQFKGIRGIFEFKTELSFKFNKRQSPEPSHIEQASWYADSLGLEWLLFRYEIRGDLFQYKTYLVPVDKAKVAEIKAKARYVKLHADNNELPPKEPDKKLCDKSYCKHKKICAEDYICDEKYESYLKNRKRLETEALGFECQNGIEEQS